MWVLVALRARFRFPQRLMKALGWAGASRGKLALDRLAQLGLVKTRTQGLARPEMLTGPAEAVRLWLAPATGAAATLILTIVDQGCSKAAKFIPCNKTIDGQGIAKLYLQHLFPWFRIPKRIISDQDPRFTSNFSNAICKVTNIQQNISSAFYPCTDGQTEHMNLWIENDLKEFVNGRQDNWSTLLPITEFTHNSWKHEHTKYTPHQLILGINPSTNLSI